MTRAERLRAIGTGSLVLVFLSGFCCWGLVGEAFFQKRPPPEPVFIDGVRLIQPVRPPEAPATFGDLAPILLGVLLSIGGVVVVAAVVVLRERSTEVGPTDPP